jgi:hypothetical protein
MIDFLFVLPIGLVFLVAILYVKGKEDAETFDSELRYLLACIHLFPVTAVAFKNIKKQYDKVSKMKGRNGEQVNVAFTEFAFKFRRFFPENKN